MLTLLAVWGIALYPMTFDSGNCRNSNSFSQNAVNYLRRIVTSTDAGNTKLRHAFQLPYVTTEPAVEHIVDEAECGRAATALEAMYGDGTPRRPVWVFRIGATRYGVSDGTGGRNVLIRIFDNNYTYLVTID